MRFVWLVTTLVLAGTGCQSALDTERARRFFEREPRPEVPELVEVAEDEATLPVPGGLRATAGLLRRVPLRWDPVLDGDVAGYVVERAPGPEAAFQRVAVLPGRFRTLWIDEGSDLSAKPDRAAATPGLGDGASFRYRVRAFDSAGRLASPPSDPLTVTTAALPAPPEVLQVFSHLPRRVALAWEPSPDSTTAGYVVLRSPTTRGDFLPVGRVEGRFHTIFQDRNLGPLRVFYYQVASVNQAGAQGPPTPAERAVTKPEPLPPAGLALAAREVGRNVLTWRPNVEVDLAGYRLLRRRAGTEEWEEVATLDAGTTQVEDTAVAAGERIHYAVVAFDRDGLESEPSEPLEVESRAWGLRADRVGRDVHLRWDAEAQAPFESTRILLEGLRTRELGRVPSEGFVDRAPPAGRRRYRILGVRPDGAESPASATVEIRVPEEPG